ncbi:hypothetical protein [Photobacterium sp. 1_MG-2023]|uniref:hypothetical protein n=1 Tax=Photobacterium sp. 1_MG-2023 TaxID=3062646 RepID=UPI0026E48AB1|nr:hypothetical protein [Photobacterium sp. 1_MG-2023]MDO6708803.1 hypothetical protein [Photobacterium sp. 1_MG-2023]
MLYKKYNAVLALAIGAVISGSSVAAIGDTARVDNLKWVADLTTQNLDGNIVVTDINGNLIHAGHEFTLGEGTVKDDLSFEPNFGSEAILVARTWTDVDGDGDLDLSAGDTIGDPVSAAWTVNSVTYEAVAGGAKIPLTSTLTVDINGTPVTTDGTSADVTNTDTISILLASDAPAEKLENVSSVVVTMSITAAQDA